MQDSLLIKKTEEYLGYLCIRVENLRREGKEFESLEVERIVSELAYTFNLKQFL